MARYGRDFDWNDRGWGVGRGTGFRRGADYGWDAWEGSYGGGMPTGGRGGYPAGWGEGDYVSYGRGYGADYHGGYAEPGRGGYGYGGQAELGRGGYGWGGYDAGRMADYGVAEGRTGWGGPTGQTAMYDADRIRAGDIMTEDPEVVTADTTVADVAKKMEELDVGIIPVVESEGSRRLRGVVTDRDLAIRVIARGKDGTTKVSECMTTDIATVNRDSSVHDVLDVMKREQVRRVPVADDNGKLVGIIAQADLAVHYAGLDLQRETEVEEAIERISEPARPRWNRQQQQRGGWQGSRMRYEYDRDLTDRVREGWHDLKRGARQMLGRGYDRR